jgi:GDP-4-dehydro-6-deoxy-D-mannose reductase
VRTVLVTGAEGFTGGHLIDFLRQRGVEAVAGVRNRGRKLALERRVGKAIVCDVSDAINVARVVAGVKPDGIIHLAGCSRAFSAACEPLEAYQSIVTGWANLLDAARRAVPRARILMISAGDVYGNAGANGQPIPETTAINPTTTFGSLKANAEAVAHTFYDNYHLDVTIARPFAYTGPGQSTDFYFPAVAQRVARWDPARSGSELKLPDLAFTRDLLHVQDVCDAYFTLLQSGKPNHVYNVCSGTAKSCREWLSGLIAASGKSIRLTDLPTETSDEQSIANLCGDNSRITSETGWKPNRRPEDALTELLRALQPASRPTPAPGTTGTPTAGATAGRSSPGQFQPANPR